jgi:hypothetical protein
MEAIRPSLTVETCAQDSVVEACRDLVADWEADPTEIRTAIPTAAAASLVISPFTNGWRTHY